MTTFEAHGIVELMGHSRIAGKLSEVTLFGSALMRVDVPKTIRRDGFTKYYSAGAIYCITPTDEATAQAAAERFDEPPVQPYILPMPTSPALAAKVRIAEDDLNDDYYDPDDLNEEDEDDGYGDYPDEDEDEEDDEHGALPDVAYDEDEEGDRLLAARMCKKLLESPFVIFALETTTDDFKDLTGDEIVQIAIIDQDGNVLLDTYVKPVEKIPNSQYHGITDAMVADAPGFPDIYEQVKAALGGKVVVGYNNIGYDDRILAEVYTRHKLDPIRFDAEADIMKRFAAFYGEWNDYFGDYRFQKLSTAMAYFKQQWDGKEHVAVNDCKATLKVMKALAAWYDEQQKESATDAAS